MSVNKCILLGNVGKDPEIRTFDNGNKVANFSLATSEKWTDKQGEKHEATEWHNVAVFNKLADIVEKYVKKGHKLYVEGKIKTRSWDDKDGNKRYSTDIVLSGFGDTLQMLSKVESNTTGQAAPVQNEQKSPEPDNSGGGSTDVPF